MNVDFGRKFETIGRVIDHCEADPDDNAGFVALLAGLREHRVRIENLIARQRLGQLDVRAATARRSKLRARIHHHMLVPVSRVATRAAAEDPEVDRLFRLPPTKSRTVVWRGAARGIVTAVEARKELFIRHGLSEAMLTELVAALDQFDATEARTHSGRDTHVGATAELAEVIRSAMRNVDVLDGLNLYRFRDDPEKLAVWTSARNVVNGAPRDLPTPPSDGGPLAPAA